MQLAPPLHHADWSKGTAELIQFGARVVAGAAGEEAKFAARPP